MRLRFGRNLNSLTDYNRINRIYKISVRTKSCHRWCGFCRKKDNPQIYKYAPNQEEEKGQLIDTALLIQ